MAEKTAAAAPSGNRKPINGQLISRQEKARLLAARAGQVTYHSTYDEEDPFIVKKGDDDEEGKADQVPSLTPLSAVHFIFLFL
jgi:hypothetical protein